MILIAVACPYCQSDRIAKRGKTETDKQRYRCQNPDCQHQSFLLSPAYKGRLPEIKKQIIDMALSGRCIRDTARVLGISTDTVIMSLKKESALVSVNQPLLGSLLLGGVNVIIRRAGEAEVDEMWLYVKRKTEPRWLWHAIAHRTGKVLAYVFGRRKDEVFLKLKALLEPLGIRRFYTDHWGAYTRHIDTEKHQAGKRKTQKIERKHLTLRTRIKRLTRKTICFSKSIQMHDIVIGLFVNRYDFGLRVQNDDIRI